MHMEVRLGKDARVPTCWEAAFSARELRLAGPAKVPGHIAVALERLGKMPAADRSEMKRKVGDLLALGSIEEIAAIGIGAIPVLVSWLEDGHMRGKAYAAIGLIASDAGMDSESVQLAIRMHAWEQDALRSMDWNRGCRSEK